MLARNFRLRRSVDIQKVVKFGERQIAPHFKIYWQLNKNNNEQALPTRSTVVVGKKVAKGAVTRNRIKRRTRAALKSLQMPAGFDLVIFPKEKVLDLPFEVLVDNLSALIKKIR